MIPPPPSAALLQILRSLVLAKICITKQKAKPVQPPARQPPRSQQHDHAWPPGRALLAPASSDHDDQQTFFLNLVFLFLLSDCCAYGALLVLFYLVSIMAAVRTSSVTLALLLAQPSPPCLRKIAHARSINFKKKEPNI